MMWDGHEVMKCFEVLLTLHYKLSSCPVVPGSVFHFYFPRLGLSGFL